MKNIKKIFSKIMFLMGPIGPQEHYKKFFSQKLNFITSDKS